jgi:cytidine deaminase
MALSAEDRELVNAARDAIRERYRRDWHVVAAALRTRSGRVFTGVHLEANVGRIAVCAEAVALGRAATEAGDTEIEAIVAVLHPGHPPADPVIGVVAPCGMCREMIADYSPEARVILPAAGGGEFTLPIRELLPHKFARP